MPNRSPVCVFERLVRTFIVEAFDEISELGLLLPEGPSCRLGHLELERQMHTFVPAVVHSGHMGCGLFEGMCNTFDWVLIDDS